MKTKVQAVNINTQETYPLTWKDIKNKPGIYDADMSKNDHIIVISNYAIDTKFSYLYICSGPESSGFGAASIQAANLDIWVQQNFKNSDKQFVLTLSN